MYLLFVQKYAIPFMQNRQTNKYHRVWIDYYQLFILGIW